MALDKSGRVMLEDHTLPATIHGNRAYSPEHNCSVEIPSGWQLRNVFGVSDPDAVFNLAPPNVNWPNIEVTFIGHTAESSIEATKEFAHNFLRNHGWPLVEERTLTVAGLVAYEISYKHWFPVWKFWLWPARGKLYCKVSVIKGNTEFLLQLAADAWERDKPTFDKCVESFNFGP